MQLSDHFFFYSIQCHSFSSEERDSVEASEPNYLQLTGIDVPSNSAQNGRAQSEPSVQTEAKQTNKQTQGAGV